MKSGVDGGELTEMDEPLFGKEEKASENGMISKKLNKEKIREEET